MSDCRVSVIVPVYNVEKYLDTCINSLITQTEPFQNIEVLLINDGSTDSSEQICQKYSEKYDNILLFSKENEGLSKTRNFGLKKANGKYIFFLDSDDTLKSNTIKNVADFFDTVYDYVDIVTYRIIQYCNGKPTVVHYRYRTLNHTGVYDLNDPGNRFITQTNINICVKNKFEKNILFDESPDFRHEDEKYCCDILMQKMKIGFCNKGEYLYNRDNANSIVSTQFLPENIFESSMKFYEDLFNKFSDTVPPYFQGIVFNDFRWKLMADKFLPTHYEGDEWVEANERIDNLLERIDSDTIIMHPSINEYHLFYWIKRKKNSYPVVIARKNEAVLCIDGRDLLKTNIFPIYLCGIDENFAKFYIDSPIFNFLEPSQFRIYTEFADGVENITRFSESRFGAKGCSTITCYCPEFRVELKKYEKITFKVYIDGIGYDTVIRIQESEFVPLQDGKINTEEYSVSVGQNMEYSLK